MSNIPSWRYFRWQKIHIRAGIQTRLASPKSSIEPIDRARSSSFTRAPPTLHDPPKCNNFFQNHFCTYSLDQYLHHVHIKTLWNLQVKRSNTHPVGKLPHDSSSWTNQLVPREGERWGTIILWARGKNSTYNGRRRSRPPVADTALSVLFPQQALPPLQRVPLLARRRRPDPRRGAAKSSRFYQEIAWSFSRWN